MLTLSFRQLAACSAVALALPFLASCSTAPVSTAELVDPAAIQSAFTLLGENGQGIARVITTAATCPDLSQDGTTATMTVRMRPATVALRPTASSAVDSKPSEFPVLTCETVLDKNVRAVQVAGHSLPVPKAEPKRILVLGDTGCRLKKADNAFQACNDAAGWPFRQISDTAASFKPDLVVHVGDYHYRETACPDTNPGCAGSPWGYGWDTWNADLFQPAASLLKAAPWVVLRGNHESCARAGQGWWRFLDPRPLVAGRDCNLEADDVHGDFSAPYAVPVGGSAQLIVFDSAKVPINPLAESDTAYQIYMEQFKTVNRLADAASFNIFMNHHPILGFAPRKMQDGTISTWPGNAALQAIMERIHAKRLFPAKVQVTLAGHVHLFEVLSFATDHPIQLVAGNGGSANSANLPQTLAVGATPYPDAVIRSFASSRTYGFMTLERQDKAWLMQAWDKSGGLMAECRLENQETTCKPF